MGGDPTIAERSATSVARNLGQSVTLDTYARDVYARGDAHGSSNDEQQNVSKHLALLGRAYLVDALAGWVPPSRSPKRIDYRKGGGMDFFEAKDVVELSNPGVVSRQLVWPGGSKDARATLTEVHVGSGAVQGRHAHEHSEQIWYALVGSGTLLLAEGGERPFRAGDVARFAPGDVHGLRNGDGEFVYVSVTTPPLDFSGAYRSRGCLPRGDSSCE